MESIDFGKLIIEAIKKKGIDIEKIEFKEAVLKYSTIFELEDRKAKLFFKINYDYKDELIKKIAYACEKVLFEFGHLKYYSICGHRIKDRETREFVCGDYYLLFDIVIEDEKITTEEIEKLEEITRPEVKEKIEIEPTRADIMDGSAYKEEKPKKKKNKKKDRKEV